MKTDWENIGSRAGEWLLKWRWAVAALMSLTTVFVEAAEHHPTSLRTLNPDFLRELLLFAIAFPLLTGALLSLVRYAREATAQVRFSAAEKERLRVARDLHDVLGQQLSYLHLKLGHIILDETLSGSEPLREQLKQVQTVLDQTYRQLRETLVALDVPTSGDLATDLRLQAQAVGERARFKLGFSATGEPCQLSIYVQRQIILLVREALSNVEQHAHARKVDIQLLWTHDALRIHFADDGEGMDFGSLPLTGHFGLGNMQRRAAEIGGSLAIESRPGAGTLIELRVPLPAATAPDRPRARCLRASDRFSVANPVAFDPEE